MNYETRKRRLKKLMRPVGEPPLAPCCGTPVIQAHRYSVASCECARTFTPAPVPPRRVRTLLDVEPDVEARLVREIVTELNAERFTGPVYR